MGYKRIEIGKKDLKHYDLASEVKSGNLSVAEIVDEMTDEQIYSMGSAMSYFMTRPEVDADGFEIDVPANITSLLSRNVSKIQKLCWSLFEENPQINSHVRDFMGTLTGAGFQMTSMNQEVRTFMDEIIYDIRNELYKFIPKWAARSEIQGELFLALSAHKDGFVEVDFMDCSSLSDGGDACSGIYHHPVKGTWPILYEFTDSTKISAKKKLIPSIYVSYYPEALEDTIKFHNIDRKDIYGHTAKKEYKKVGGFETFIVSWDRGYLTKRNSSHVRTTVEWIMHYVNLKKWEIDHKKSSGSYLWVVEVDNAQAFRSFMKMPDDEKAKTGLFQKKVPGGQLILPPGFKLKCENPKLASISEQDTDIMHMVTSGLNKPEDMVTGQTKGDTFSGIKASRGPQADRTKDDLEFFSRFLRYDLWRSIIHLASILSGGEKVQETYSYKKVVDFKDKKGKYKNVTVETFKLLDFLFPQSEITDIESKCKALLGVNHQSVIESLGIPRRLIAQALGFQSYNNHRYELAEEDDLFPVLPATLAAEAAISQKQFGNTQFKKNNGTPDEENDEENQDDKVPTKKKIEKKVPDKKKEAK